MPTALLPLTVAEATCCEPITQERLGEAQAEDLARSLKALADPTRLRMISLIAGSPDQEACVCDITDVFDLGQPTVSHHLKVLLGAGYVTRSKRGTWAYYKLVPGTLDAVSRVFQSA
jgi:ArsR family transcriptional regulator